MPRDPAIWLVMIDGQESNPMTRADLAQAMAAGDVDAGSFAWCDGMDEWKPAREIAELADLFAPPKRGKPPPPPAAAKAHKPKSKGTGSEDGNSHAFRGSDDEEEEIVLELDMPEPPKKQGAPSRPEPVKPLAPAPSAQASSRGLPGKTPPQPYGVPLAKETSRPLPKAAAAKAAAEEEDGDWADRTSVEVLPFGERIHQDNIAGSLFSEQLGVGKTGQYALDVETLPVEKGKPGIAIKPVTIKPAVPTAAPAPAAATPRASASAPGASAPAKPMQAASAALRFQSQPAGKKTPVALFAGIGIAVLVVGAAVVYLFVLK